MLSKVLRRTKRVDRSRIKYGNLPKRMQYHNSIPHLNENPTTKQSTNYETHTREQLIEILKAYEHEEDVRNTKNENLRKRRKRMLNILILALVGMIVGFIPILYSISQQLGVFRTLPNKYLGKWADEDGNTIEFSFPSNYTTVDEGVEQSHSVINFDDDTKTFVVLKEEKLEITKDVYPEMTADYSYALHINNKKYTTKANPLGNKL
eukprot:TRINITY_DN4605_c0_g2_i1.p1 TRINITY_DN4605_c0_g2~~TRINITY_DN4605_c0_g2_i1.p1  ORF type:complete len:207 (-),score=30.73 TRINITY_DN4605_c0_g2_i1:9-629(-)